MKILLIIKLFRKFAIAKIFRSIIKSSFLLFEFSQKVQLKIEKMQVWVFPWLYFLMINGFWGAEISCVDHLSRQQHALQVVGCQNRCIDVLTLQHLINQINEELESLKEQERTEREKLQIVTQSYETTQAQN